MGKYLQARRGDDGCGRTSDSISGAASEQMNHFARSLNSDVRFHSIRTGANIRDFASGWSLEKWVEGEVDAAQGFWAAWWLELGMVENQWQITSHVSISHSNFYVEFPSRLATSIGELQAGIDAAVEELTTALQHRSDFAAAVGNCSKPRSKDFI